jgi:DNA-binding response OmpR family regulator
MTPQPAAAPTILLAEDDATVARMLIDFLEARGYEVWHTATAAQIEARLASRRPDLIILDLVLPDASGLILCTDLKARTGAPVIVCSASRRKEDPVLSLRLGAEDFVAKPFSPAELLARIEMALRRSAAPAAAEPAASTELSVGALTIDQARCRVALNGQSLHVTPSEYRLLQALASRPDQVLGRQELAECVWGYFDPDVGRSLDVHVSRLRSKLAQAANGAPALVTVRGFGYRLAPSAPVPAPAPACGVAATR